MEAQMIKTLNAPARVRIPMKRSPVKQSKKHDPHAGWWKAICEIRAELDKCYLEIDRLEADAPELAVCKPKICFGFYHPHNGEPQGVYAYSEAEIQERADELFRSREPLLAANEVSDAKAKHHSWVNILFLELEQKQAAHRAARDAAGLKDLDSTLDRLNKRLDDLESKMVDVPATSLEGLKAQAEFLYDWCSMYTSRPQSCLESRGIHTMIKSLLKLHP